MKNLFSKKITRVKKDVLGQCFLGCIVCFATCGTSCFITCIGTCVTGCLGECADGCSRACAITCDTVCSGTSYGSSGE
jgi:ribosomally synthesized peptide (Cys-rich family)